MAEIKLKIASVVIGSGEGGGSSVAPYYADLPDKPSINGETLSGDMTSEDLGLASDSQAVPSGGTTGQVLAKKSNADNDVQWVNQESGGQGTTDYADLENKPKINNVTLSGNKTAAQLGLQPELVSGTNIKTINNQSIVGTGNITIDGGTDDYADLSNKPQINSVSLSGNKSASDLGLATAAQGTKADNAIPMPATGTDGYILEKDSNVTGGVKWVEKPTNGKSAYDIWYEENGYSDPNTYNEEYFLASLKAQFGSFVPADYYDDNGGSDEGKPASSGSVISPDQNTTNYIYLVDNNSDPTSATAKVMWITVVDETNPSNTTYSWQNIGEVQVSILFKSGQSLDDVNIVNDLTTGGADDVLSAEQGKKLNKEKLDKDSDSYTFYITDSNNNVICQIDAEGIHSVNYTYKDGTDSLADENGNVSLIAKLISILTAISEKQDNLTFDNTPTAESNNPVKSGGIKTSLDAKFDKEISDNSLIITDSNGYIICKIDADGVHAPNIQDNGGNIVLNNNSLVVTDPNGYIVLKIDNNGIHSVVDKHAVACMVLSENYYPTSTPIRDSNGNITHANVIFGTGVVGEIDITYTNGNASYVVVEYNSKQYAITINRDINGNVTTVSVTETN